MHLSFLISKFNLLLVHLDFLGVRLFEDGAMRGTTRMLVHAVPTFHSPYLVVVVRKCSKGLCTLQ